MPTRLPTHLPTRLPTLCAAALVLSCAGALRAQDHQPGAAPADLKVIMPGERVDLRYRWRAGEVLHYRIVQQTDSSLKDLPGAGELRVAQTQTTHTTMTVRALNLDGSAIIDWSFDSIRAQVRRNDDPLASFDSRASDTAAAPSDPHADDPHADDPHASDPHADDPMTHAMRAMVGRTITLTIAPDGRILDMRGVDALRAAVSEPLAGTEARTMRPDLRAFLSDDALRDQFEQAFRLMPAEPVAAGESWERSESRYFPMAGTVDARTRFRYEGAGPLDGVRAAKLSAVSTLSLATMGQHDRRTVVGKPTLAGAARGGTTAWLDLATGRLLRLESVMAAPLDVARHTPSGDTATIRVESISRLTMTLAEASARAEAPSAE
ncbi:MAG TPA: hypothetical protein DEB06_05315 [Phycisphaerales bacterium]|nr:hypothetical protein [Phycisphaerales bacterium]